MRGRVMRRRRIEQTRRRVTSDLITWIDPRRGGNADLEQIYNAVSLSDSVTQLIGWYVWRGGLVVV